MLNLDKIIKEAEEALKVNPDNAQAFQIYGMAKLLDFISHHHTHNDMPMNYPAEAETGHFNRYHAHHKRKMNGEIIPQACAVPLHQDLCDIEHELQLVWSCAECDEERKAVKDFAERLYKTVMSA